MRLKDKFMQSYDKRSIAKYFEFMEGEGKEINADINFAQNKDFQINQIGRTFANVENRFILERLINSKFIINEKLSVNELSDFVLKNDPDNIHIIFTSTSVRNELLKAGIINLNENEYTLMGRKVVAVDNNVLKDNLMLVCNEINHLEGNEIELSEEDNILFAKRNLDVLFSKQKIWLCEVEGI